MPRSLLGRDYMIRTNIKWGKMMRKDRNAGIEGLPLQLMVLVLIAGVGTAVMMGWMSGLKAPSSIGSVHVDANEIVLGDADNDGLYSDDGVVLTVTVLDQNGDAIEGATVVLTGCQVSNGKGGNPHGVTDAQGQVRFTGLSLMTYGGEVGFVKVTAAKSGMGTDSSTSIPVVCG